MFVPVSLGTGPEWWVLQRRCKKGGKHLKPFWAKKIVETWPFLNWPWTRSLEGSAYAMCISPSSLSCTLEILIPFHRWGNWSTCISKELAKDTRQDNSRAGLESLSSKSISSARWHWPLLHHRLCGSPSYSWLPWSCSVPATYPLPHKRKDILQSCCLS